MKYTILILFSLISIQNFAQRIEQAKLCTLGDSIFSSAIGDIYLKYYKLDTTSYYKYRNIFGKTIRKEFNNRDIYIKRFNSASLQFKIDFPFIKELSSTLYITIDKDFNVKTFISDIPAFILENRECDFISKDMVIEIGDSLLKEQGVKTEYYLVKEHNSENFTWNIYNIIREPDEGKFLDGLMEVISIDPLTGKILDHQIKGYGYVF